MAKSTTFKGQAKPYGKKGHFYEKRRHQLQAKGVRTGKLAKTNPVPKREPFIDFGIIPDNTYKELEKEELKFLKEPEFEYETVIEEATAPIEPEVAGAEEVEIEGDEVEVKKPTKGFMRELFSGWKAERDVKGRRLRQRALTQLGREEEDFEEPEFETRGQKFGKILADLFADYRSDDLLDLTDAELEQLAIKFDAHAGGLIGKPSNPFLEELKKRIKAKEHVKYEKLKLDAELEPSRLRIQKEIEDIRKSALEGSKDGDIIERLLGV